MSFIGALAQPEFQQMYQRKEWHALASAAQSLMCVAQTAAAAHDIEGCVDVLALAGKYVCIQLPVASRASFCEVPHALRLETAHKLTSEMMICFRPKCCLPNVVQFNCGLHSDRYCAVDINLSPTTRHNACMAMLALTSPGLLPPADVESLEQLFAQAAEDDDRYVMRCAE